MGSILLDDTEYPVAQRIGVNFSVSVKQCKSATFIWKKKFTDFKEYTKSLKIQLFQFGILHQQRKRKKEVRKSPSEKSSEKLSTHCRVERIYFQ